MPLDPAHLAYPRRRRGMDHDLYPASNLFERPPVTWPGGKTLALWLTVSIEHFPLTPNEGPFRAPGHMVTPYPDYRTFTTRDYGNRVGVYRILRALESAGLPATAFVSSALVARAPALLADLASAGWEIAAHGVDMNHVHLGGMAEAEERDQIRRCLDQLGAAGIEPRGWLSPGRSESAATLALLAEAGLSWVADWDNDDMPYAMTGGLVAMPYTEELQDRRCLIDLGQGEEVWREQILDAARWLAAEAEKHGGRVLHVALTPYVAGQPFRIRILKDILAALSAHEAVWPATGSAICDAWRASQETA